jgi:hypothetical protein
MTLKGNWTDFLDQCQVLGGTEPAPWLARCRPCVEPLAVYHVTEIVYNVNGQTRVRHSHPDDTGHLVGLLETWGKRHRAPGTEVLIAEEVVFNHDPVTVRLTEHLLRWGEAQAVGELQITVDYLHPETREVPSKEPRP